MNSVNKIRKLNNEKNKIGFHGVCWHIVFKAFYKWDKVDTTYRVQYAHMKYEKAWERYINSLNGEQMKEELESEYKNATGDDLDLAHPIDFNQKIQWLKIYDTTPLKTRLADKYLVREWIEEKIGGQYLIPLLGVWNNADEIDFDKLPNRFCLKANHGSGMNYVVKDKTVLTEKGIKKLRKMMNIWMQRPFGMSTGLELQYVDIPRKIIAEKYIEQSDGNLFDYKIHCFNGKPKIIQIIGERDLAHHTGKEIFLDMNWEKRELMYHSYDSYDEIPEKPAQYDEMIAIAKKLSEDFIYVRVDLYIVHNLVYFGEMTFTPASGFTKWGGNYPSRMVGSWIKLG